jgi:hypothetical protein
MANTEFWTVETYFNDTLKGDPDIAAAIGRRVYSNYIPARIRSSDTTYPCILFQSTDPDELKGTANTTIAVSDVYAVEVISRELTAETDAIAAKVKEVLNGTRIELPSGKVFSCTSEKPISYPEEDNGVEYFHRGWLFRVLVH